MQERQEAVIICITILNATRLIKLSSRWLRYLKVSPSITITMSTIMMSSKYRC